MFARVEKKYNHIVSNPPIKTGKAKLFEFVDGALEHLELNGTLTLVIKKNLGEESLKKYIISKFGNCEIWERDKGYYILHTIKTF
jgi:16S rRNA (guanine1207-N2)-methyltransferase